MNISEPDTVERPPRYAEELWMAGVIPTLRINPGLAFLERASARLLLVEQGEITVEEAITGLAPAFYDLMNPVCACAREAFERMERNYPHALQKPKKPRRRK